MEKDLINLRNKFLRAGLKKEAQDIQILIKEAKYYPPDCTANAKYNNKCVDASNKPKKDGAIYQMQELINSKGEKIKSDGFFGDNTAAAILKLLPKYDKATHTADQVMNALKREAKSDQLTHEDVSGI